MRRFVFVLMLLAPKAYAGAGTLEDMDLRSNVEASVRGTASTANLILKIRVENRVVTPQGIVRDLNQADEVAELASRVRGVESVDRSGLRFEFGGVSDDEVASRVMHALSELPEYGASTKVAVDHGVVTLNGKVTNASWRSDIRKVCGAIQGVAEVVDKLESPDTPDERIQKALDHIFGARAVPRFPGKVRAVVTNGAVLLEGRVPSLRDRHSAAKTSWALNGVRSVEDHLELSSDQAVQVVRP